MNDFTSNVDFYIDNYNLEKQIFKLGDDISKRGWTNKDEFLAICLWKSRRPKKLYQLNSAEFIKEQTKLTFSEKDEILKIKHLTKLQGVRIPTASAILSVHNPGDYPIIDERCIQSLKTMKLIDWENISDKHWLEYLSIVQDLAKKHNKTAREIEKGLFAYNRIKLDKEYRNLY